MRALREGQVSSDLTAEHLAPDLLEDSSSVAAQKLLDDTEYLATYKNLLSGFLASANFSNGNWYTNMWPACRKETTSPAVLVVGRATRGQWSERIDRADFPVERAIDTAARKDMGWVDLVRSQYIRTALAIVEALPSEFRGEAGSASLDIVWSDLYKIARENNPTSREMSIQGALGTGALLAREVEVLKPKVVLAFTQSYSRKDQTAVGGWFEDIMGECRRVVNRPSAAPLTTRIHDVPCIVGVHPQAGPSRNQYVSDALRTLELS